MPFKTVVYYFSKHRMTYPTRKAEYDLFDYEIAMFFNESLIEIKFYRGKVCIKVWED